MPRKMISWAMFWLRPDSAEPIRKIVMPIMQHRLAAVDVGQLAAERDRDRAREQVDRDRPDVVVVARQLGHDRGQRRTDDRLVQRAEEQAEQDGEEDLHLRPVGQVEGRVVLERRRRRSVGMGRFP